MKHHQRKTKKKIGCKVNTAICRGNWSERIKAIALAAGGEVKPAPRALLELIHRQVFLKKYTF
jgi:hypothetical protein